MPFNVPNMDWIDEAARQIGGVPGYTGERWWTHLLDNCAQGAKPTLREYRYTEQGRDFQRTDTRVTLDGMWIYEDALDGGIPDFHLPDRRFLIEAKINNNVTRRQVGNYVRILQGQSLDRLFFLVSVGYPDDGGGLWNAVTGGWDCTQAVTERLGIILWEDILEWIDVTEELVQQKRQIQSLLEREDMRNWLSSHLARQRENGRVPTWWDDELRPWNELKTFYACVPQLCSWR